MAAIDPAVPNFAAFFKNSRLWSIASVHTKERAAASSRWKISGIPVTADCSGRRSIPRGQRVTALTARHKVLAFFTLVNRNYETTVGTVNLFPFAQNKG